MNLTNFFSKKNKGPEPEYFLAVEIHESLIKTALWEVLDGQTNVTNVGSYELWADEDSLINGVDSSLEQAVKVISSQPNKVIFGLPDSWMEEDKIHPTKTKLITRLCKELGLEPIGAVTINRAVAHYLKKRDGVPPTAILLELYTTKIALSYVYLGEVKSTEEVAKSGDIGSDVEEGLARMDLPNYPARFILTNGSDLVDESQQITAHPWQDKLPFKHLPKVEALPVDFSIKAIALIGGTEAVKFMGLPIKEESEELHKSPKNDLSESVNQESFTIEEEPKSKVSLSDSDNLKVPDSTPDISEHGFFYEEVAPPESSDEPQNHANEEEASNLSDFVEEEVSFHQTSASNQPTETTTNDITYSEGAFPQRKIQTKKLTLPKLPSLPKLKLPRLKTSLFPILAAPLILIALVAGYFFLGSALVTIKFVPQSFNQTLTVSVSDTPLPDKPTLIASMQKVTGSTKETTATTGTATVGERATGTVTIANKTVAPLVLKKGTILTTDNGKYAFSLDEEVTIASASSGLLDVISGKATGVKVTATKIGPEYNLSQDNTLTVDSYSRTVSVAVTEKEFTGGTSRTVNAVSKADQDKLISQAAEKIKQITDSQVSSAAPGKKTIPVSELQLTKKTFDKTVGEESTTLSLDLEGSLDIYVYDEIDLFRIVESELKSKIPAGNTIQPNSTNIKVESLQKDGNGYLANITVSASLYPEADTDKLREVISGKQVSKIRDYFAPIKGFTGADVVITPPIPVLGKYMPLKKIDFEFQAN